MSENLLEDGFFSVVARQVSGMIFFSFFRMSLVPFCLFDLNVSLSGSRRTPLPNDYGPSLLKGRGPSFLR